MAELTGDFTLSTVYSGQMKFLAVTWADVLVCYGHTDSIFQDFGRRHGRDYLYPPFPKQKVSFEWP